MWQNQVRMLREHEECIMGKWSASKWKQTKSRVPANRWSSSEVNSTTKMGGEDILNWKYLLMATKPPFPSGRCSSLSWILQYCLKEDSQVTLPFLLPLYEICTALWQLLTGLGKWLIPLCLLNLQWPWSQYFHRQSESNGSTQLSLGCSQL